MTKNWIGLSLAVVVLTASASAGFACDDHAAAADAKDAKDAKGATAVAANDAPKGCDLPCCAHAKEAAGDTNAANEAGGKPCAANAAKACPKKATATTAAAAKPEPAKDTAKAEPAPNPGTHR